MTPTASLQEYLRARRVEIDRALECCLPQPPACPAIIAEAMRYSVFAGGKRFRPTLTLASAEAVGDARRERQGPVSRIPTLGPQSSTLVTDLAMPAACAIELIHTYSLIHDDLPAMDNDTLRRGRPTAHVVYGEGIAILAGDGLLTEAFSLMAREPAGGDSELERRRLQAMARVAQAAGALGMVGGQALDLQGAAIDADALRGMYARKTGALIRAAAVAGAIMAGGSEAAVGAVDCYADDLGLAFQIVDDILDVEGHTDQLGKTAGKDAAAGKPTYPALYGVAESRRLAEACVARARQALAAADLVGRLADLAEWVIARTN